MDADITLLETANLSKVEQSLPLLSVERHRHPLSKVLDVRGSSPALTETAIAPSLAALAAVAALSDTQQSKP